MTNNLKNFLEKEQITFSDDYCEFKLCDTITKPELLNYKHWLEAHDTRLINFVLDLVEKEVEKPEVASGVMLDQRGRKWVELKDLKTIINNLRV